MIKEIPFEVECPGCGKTTEHPITANSPDLSSIKCSCGSIIEIDTKSAKKELVRLNRLASDAFKDINKKISIKL